MIHAYSDLYISSAQQILGEAVDFAVLTLEIEPDDFGSAYCVSDVSKQFAAGNPRYVAGMNGCELARECLDSVCYPYTDKVDAMYIDKSPEYWTGWALAYYQWFTGLSFMEILNSVPLSEILQMYSVYHEMDIAQFVDEITRRIRVLHPATKLQERRKLSGYSQSELAEAAGISKRQIQLYEERQRDINKASAITLYKLSKTMNCDMEDLLEKI